jgi:hypothetical protein
MKKEQLSFWEEVQIPNRISIKNSGNEVSLNFA